MPYMQQTDEYTFQIWHEVKDFIYILPGISN